VKEFFSLQQTNANSISQYHKLMGLSSPGQVFSFHNDLSLQLSGSLILIVQQVIQGKNRAFPYEIQTIV